ncbi:MAG: rRNA pseudouridine synthase [Ignavibacteria bacterium]|nr:rRNA pseudouridine synthase [Ignavibacteria bacterium]
MASMETKSSDIHKETIRLNRFLAMAGKGSRRKNDELILSGAVKVNGKTITELGVQVRPGRDRVTVHGQPVSLTQKHVYIVLNKPKDCITTMSDERGRTTVMDYVKQKQRIYPVGRLDRNTTGVLLFTNEGELAHALTHPSRGLEKVYHVRVDKEITDLALQKLRRGVLLDDGKAKAERVEVLPGTRRLEAVVTVVKGRNRIIRRMVEALGYETKKLDRISFCGITTERLARGKWRYLTATEINGLRSLAGVI